MNWIQDILKKCLENLDSLACEYGIHDVEWKIYNKDYLKEMNNKKFVFYSWKSTIYIICRFRFRNESIYKR